jgi:hypothetical protein
MSLSFLPNAGKSIANPGKVFAEKGAVDHFIRPNSIGKVANIKSRYGILPRRAAAFSGRLRACQRGDD